MLFFEPIVQSFLATVCPIGLQSFVIQLNRAIHQVDNIIKGIKNDSISLYLDFCLYLGFSRVTDLMQSIISLRSFLTDSSLFVASITFLLNPSFISLSLWSTNSFMD